MDRVAVFIDARYLFAQGSTLLAGRKLPRGEAHIDHGKVIEAFKRFAERVSGMKLLRIYWYDGTSSGPTPQHIALAYQADVKLRLGFVNSVGQQKGVDSLIVTDMITLSRNRAMSEAVLLSGDEDLRVGVLQAQEFGVRVHLVGIKPGRGSQSIFLVQEADATYEWDESDLAPFMTCAALRPEAPQLELIPDLDQGEEPVGIIAGVAQELVNDVPAQELESLVASLRATKQVPRELDARLLAKSRAGLGQNLDSDQKREARAAFLLACETRLAAFAVAQILPEV